MWCLRNRHKGENMKQTGKTNHKKARKAIRAHIRVCITHKRYFDIYRALSLTEYNMGMITRADVLLSLECGSALNRVR